MVLLPFGGAGPLHAAALAEQLGIVHLLCPRASGVLSALGLAAAAPRRDQARSVLLGGEQLSAQRVRGEREWLLGRARAALGTAPARARVRHELRYAGQAFELAVDEELADPDSPDGLGPDELRAAFVRAHEQRYGYSDLASEVELVTMRLSLWGPAPQLAPAPASGKPPAGEPREITFAGRQLTAAVFRGEPPPDSEIEGPALWALPEATLLVPPGWGGRVDGQGSVHLSRKQEG
jgi:N-methylhydantoinase A